MHSAAYLSCIPQRRLKINTSSTNLSAVVGGTAVSGDSKCCCPVGWSYQSPLSLVLYTASSPRSPYVPLVSVRHLCFWTRPPLQEVLDAEAEDTSSTESWAAWNTWERFPWGIMSDCVQRLKKGWFLGWFPLCWTLERRERERRTKSWKRVIPIIFCSTPALFFPLSHTDYLKSFYFLLLSGMNFALPRQSGLAMGKYLFQSDSIWLRGKCLLQ